VPFWLCVGDIATDDGRYESLGAPLYWIHGNNDNFDAIAADTLPPDLHHIANGTAVEIEMPGLKTRPTSDTDGPPTSDTAPDGGAVDVADVGRVFRPGILRVAGLGGTFAPTWYETRALDLPHPKKATAKATELADPSTGSGSSRVKSRDDKRRHFVREEVDACKAIADVDIFMTHEAAKPFRAYPGGKGPDAGKAQINEVLAAMKPRLHLFGHHHRFSDEVREGVRSVGLDLVTRSYVLLDAASFDVRLMQMR
jgi:hypothetical protein